MIDESILKAEEKAVYNLRSLYARYGYQPYKMSKFEEYDLYARNKDFLVSDGIISFTDTNGKLMALKPDVTLSILKNSKDVPHCTQRVYYNENVYRISGDTHQFKEIMQTGLECIGIIDFFNTTEVLKLAARSLETLSPNYVLEISHMGILNALLEEEDAGDRFNEEITSCLDEKNPHELSRICRKYQVSDTLREKLLEFVHIYGERHQVLRDLDAFCDTVPLIAAKEELQRISDVFDETPYSDKVRFDFSLVNDMKYYNGIVFQVFIAGIPEVVLTGGQYDRLLSRMGRKSSGLGFAIYLDLLDYLHQDPRDYDVDVVVLYNDDTQREALEKAVEGLRSEGETVSVQREIPGHLNFRKLMNFNGEEIVPYE